MEISFGHVARLTHRLTQRSRSGQSLILIAFAFIALIAFVGIATDVAMLFVRYSTLRRAVDAAAIAAAGQVREDVNFMTLNATAKQFIQIHGIDPNRVKVETCDTEILDYIAAQTAQGLPAPSSAAALNALISGSPPSELCKRNPQKLVRVTAQIDSPTAFLAIIGWRTVTLETSSVAQTAVLDVAIVLDSSLSEMQDTINAQMASDASGNLIYPCRIIDAGTNKDKLDPCGSSADGYADNSKALQSFKDFTNPSPTWNAVSSSVDYPPDPNWGPGLAPWGSGDQKSIRDECWMNPAPDNTTTAANYAWAGCCNDPTTQTDDLNSTGQPTIGYYATHDANGRGSGALQDHQVRTSADTAFGDNNTLHNIGLPGQGLLKGYNPDPNWYLYDDESLPQSVIMTNGQNPFAQGKPAAKVFSGQPDGNKSDLICHPFKDVRDAARRFIRRLDFVRGDRVVLVTFDSGARAMLPYNSSIPILTDKNTAVTTLNMQVGVEVNPVPVQGSGSCQSLNTVSSQYSKFGDPSQYPAKPDVPGSGQLGGQYAASDYYVDANGGLQPFNKGLNMASYWTVSQCPDTNTGGGIQAANNALINPNWIRRESVWVMIVLSDGYPNRTPAVGNGGIMSSVRDSLQVQNASADNPDYNMPSSIDSPSALDQDKIAQYCNLFLTPTPGPSPTPQVGQPTPTLPVNPSYGQQPQWCITNAQTDTAAQPYRYPPYAWGLTPANGGTAQGSFGFCPWWTFCDLNPSDTASHPYSDPYTRLTQCTENNKPGIWASSAQEPVDPYCTDNDPNARHSCIDGTGRVNPGAGDSPNPATYICDPHYDATDYARDRADFAGLINYMDNGSDGKPKKGNFIAIYSIFFDHGGRTRPLGANILGVKFMRYLADVGDNGIVDNHLQHWYRDVRDGVITGGTAWSNPPTGLDSAQSIMASGVTRPPSAQPTPASYDGSLPLWSDGSQPFQYSADEDPCARYDYAEIHLDPLNLAATPAPGSPQYENAARQDCGQYFYADSPSKVTSAFIEIASRLFTRLSR